jgi:hypothetical protein
MSDGMLQLLNAALATGSGTGKPTGTVTALAGRSSVVNTGTGTTLAASDVYAVQDSLGPRFQANARWICSLAVANALRQMAGPRSFQHGQHHRGEQEPADLRRLLQLRCHPTSWFGANSRPAGQRGVYM